MKAPKSPYSTSCPNHCAGPGRGWRGVTDATGPAAFGAMGVRVIEVRAMGVRVTGVCVTGVRVTGVRVGAFWRAGRARPVQVPAMRRRLQTQVAGARVRQAGAAEGGAAASGVGR